MKGRGAVTSAATAPAARVDWADGGRCERLGIAPVRAGAFVGQVFEIVPAFGASEPASATDTRETSAVKADSFAFRQRSH